MKSGDELDAFLQEKYRESIVDVKTNKDDKSVTIMEYKLDSKYKVKRRLR
jgi:hypothetical protein